MKIICAKCTFICLLILKIILNKLTIVQFVQKMLQTEKTIVKNEKMD